MPIEILIDHARRLVTALGSGRLTDADVFDYQREIGSRSDLRGYDELVDLSGIEEIAPDAGHRVQELAAKASATDPPTGTGKLAILAPTDVAFAIGRMYEAYRELESGDRKRVHVSRTREDAMRFLEPDAPSSGHPTG